MTLTLYEGSPHDPITVSVASSTAGLSFNRSDLANTVTFTQTAAGNITCSNDFTVAGTIYNTMIASSSRLIMQASGTSALMLNYNAGTGGVGFCNGTNGAWVASVTSAGIITGSGAYVNSSDIRLKTNVATLTDALNKVEALRGVSFEWNNNSPLVKNEPQIGLIAQEVQEVLPEVVSPSVEGYLGVAYGSIVPVLVEAIKELAEQNKQLSARINALEAAK